MVNELQEARFGAWPHAGHCRAPKQVAVLLLGLVTLPLLQAQTFTTLYNFSWGSDGGAPFAGAIQDAAGNLYGTTFAGGDLNCGGSGYGCGVVYKLDTAGTETVLHSFSGSDGEYPYTLSPSGKLLAVGGSNGLQVFHYNGADPITHYTGLLVQGAIDQIAWDDDNHLYAVSHISGKLFVFTVTPTGHHQAPGSPYAITTPWAVSVLPKT